MDRGREDLLTIYQAALDAVNGRDCVARYLQDNKEIFNKPVYMIAMGKAAVSMVEGALDVLGGNIADAFVATKLGYAAPLPWTVYEGGHPRWYTMYRNCQKMPRCWCYCPVGPQPLLSYWPTV